MCALLSLCVQVSAFLFHFALVLYRDNDVGCKRCFCYTFNTIFSNTTVNRKERGDDKKTQRKKERKKSSIWVKIENDEEAIQ